MILLINELVNITISSLFTESLQDNHALLTRILEKTVGHPSPQLQWATITLVSMALTMPLLLIVGEITPKLIATKMNRVVAIMNSKVLVVLHGILFPLLWTMDAAIGFVLRKFKAEGRDHLSKTMQVLSEDDFILLMEQGHSEGTVDPSERKLITNVFEFDDSTVSEVMTPITQAFSVSASARVSEVLPDIRTQKYSRIPVYQKNRKNVVGVLYVKDLLALRDHPELKETEVRSLMTRAMVVGPNMRLSVLFRRFKDSKTHMAIVAAGDEDAVGVVTMEDVLESIFGEIADERDVK
jgi:putative hemolysin